MEDLISPEMLAKLPNTVLWFLFVYLVVVRDLDKRLNGLSSYIKRFLALQQRRAKGQEALAQAISDLCKCLDDNN